MIPTSNVAAAVAPRARSHCGANRRCRPSVGTGRAAQDCDVVVDTTGGLAKTASAWTVRVGGETGVTAPGPARAPQAARSPSAISRAAAGRPPGDFASARRSSGTTSRGRPAAPGPSSGGGCWTCRRIVATGVSPRKGTWPVKASKITTPSE